MKTTTLFKNSIICSLWRNNLLAVTLVLVCIVFLHEAHAVSPPPDGGYPGGNTAEGQDALLNLTTGMYNTAVGLFSLESNITGNFNSDWRRDSSSNTVDNNTATGAGALLSNTTGESNTANGVFSLFDKTTGGSNTRTRFAALCNNTTGSFNTANGVNALLNNTTANSNTATAFQALQGNTTGADNTTGDSNTALGISAGLNITTAANVICIGTESANVNNSCFIGNIYSNVQPIVGMDPDAVTITSTGRLGRGNVSSCRYKHDIKPIAEASEVLYALKPVSFRFNKEMIRPRHLPSA